MLFGVDPYAIRARSGYFISEVGKPSDFVLVVDSCSTGRYDCTVKRDDYAGYSVREYRRFGHTGAYQPTPVEWGQSLMRRTLALKLLRFAPMLPKQRQRD